MRDVHLGNDRDAKFGRHQVDDGLLFLGNLHDAGLKPGFGKQFHGQIVAVRPGATLGHD
jgi:hypothetical protein